MASSLQSLPACVVESIIDQLDLDDICSLRLSCKSLGAGSASYRFRTFFQTKHVDVAIDSLRVFAEAAEAGGLSSLVQNIYLVGIADVASVRKQTNDNDPREEEARLLTEAFDGLAKHRDGPLPSLTLRVAVICDGDRILPADTKPRSTKSIWQCANQTFETAFRALGASKLRVERLGLFNDIDMQRCSLACDRLNLIDWNDPRLAGSLQTSVTSLSISLSSPNLTFNKGDDEDEDEEETSAARRERLAEIQIGALGESNFDGLARLLQLCPRLDNFELNYRHLKTHYGGWDAFPSAILFPSEKIMQRVVALERFPVLKRCRIRGICARTPDLLDFIKRTKTCDLSLESMAMYGTAFRPIVDYCTSETAGLSKLCLDTIYQMDGEGPKRLGRIHFLGPGKARVCWLPEGVGSEMLEREGEDIRLPVAYHATWPRPLGSPYTHMWSHYRRTEYGFA